MKKERDASGQELLAYFNRKEAHEIIERDDHFVDLSVYGPRSYFAEYKSWPKWQKQAVKYAHGKILDIGCGAGRVCLYLQSKGMDVTGIDVSPFAINVCKKRGVKHALVRPIEGISKFHPDYFNTVIMFGNNFGLFGNFKKAKGLLKKLYTITSKDAVILAESTDPYKTDGYYAYHKHNLRKGRMAGQIRIRVRFRNYVGGWFDYLLVSKKEMVAILKGTGWGIKKTINSGKSVYIAVIRKIK